MNGTIPSLPHYPAQQPVPVRPSTMPKEPPRKMAVAVKRKPMHPKMEEQIERMKRGEMRNKKAGRMGRGVVGDRPKKSARAEYY